MTTEPLTGGCQCGAVRYAISVARPAIYACHCRECQHQSGSAYGLSRPVRRAAVDLTGALAAWERSTDSGARTCCSYCPSCGTRIHHGTVGPSEWLTLKPGTLDDPSAIVARAHIWVRSKQPWVRLDPASPAFDTQPDDLAGWRSSFVEEIERG
jgi:hypothetical protein